MKLPLSWLRDYVDVEATAEEIAEKLTFSGTEVEGIETVGGDYSGVVVGEVLAIDPHPNADRLRLCRVSDGRDERQVVCGADNVEVGDKAAFAGVGVTLANGMPLKRARIRGQESFGMLCAEDELGISDDHGGILILPRDATPGAPLREVLGPPETVLNLDITWNRPDCLSVIGMAREIAALYGTDLKIPAIDLQEGVQDVGARVTVRVEAPDACPRYTARLLADVAIRPSPPWMQRRLSLCGVRPICNIVDVTNYVMLECGQPLHAFDYARLADGQIVVRQAREGEPLATLDGVTRDIDAQTLVIADAGAPVALAGVMGGAGSEIGDETRHVLLESAGFDPASIRRTSSALGLTTESSHRFERGVDVGGVEWASRRAAALMVALGGGTLARGVIDVYPGKSDPRRIRITTERMSHLLGFDLDMPTIESALTAVGLSVGDSDAGGCTVTVPSFRLDLTIEADLIEEVARIHGLDKVPDKAPSCRVVPDADDSAFRSQAACRDNLVGLGLHEIVNYSFVSPQLLKAVPAQPAKVHVVLPNPVSEEQSVLRPSLLPQMVATLGRNLARQVGDAALFEMGTVFRGDEAGPVAEHTAVCVGLLGPVGRTELVSQSAVSEEECFLWLKGIVEGLLHAQGIVDAGFEPCAGPCYASGRAATITVGKAAAGTLGLLNDAIRDHWRMGEPVGVAEVALDALIPAGDRRTLTTPSPYPAVTRDVAMVVAETVSHARIVETVQRSAREELTAVRLFDIFRGEGMGEGRKSLAYSLEFRSAERSLTDEDANRYHEAVKSALRSELGAEIRDK